VRDYFRPDFNFPNNVDLVMSDAAKGLQPRKQNRGPKFDGHVRMSQRYSGKMHTTFELQRFPFDSQSLWVVTSCRAWCKHEVPLTISTRDKCLGIEGGASIDGFVIFQVNS
jgi:hypothetical protein